jgi:deazaflavin-dependent oxidoreductase (nitroreductase family)
MGQDEEIHDSPTGWVKKHIQSYVESDGSKGLQYNGYVSLLLTTRGRKSGLLRRTALYYGENGDNYVIVASNGGDDHHPSWYLNLSENPEVEVQVGADKFTALAHTADAEERATLWPLMVKIFPTYAKYQAKSKREIPVVVLVKQ